MSVRCPAALDRLLEDIDWSRCSGRDLHRLSMTLINDDLGRAAYQLVTSRFGGGRRLYALAGHKATKVQNSKFNRSWDETLSALSRAAGKPKRR